MNLEFFDIFLKSTEISNFMKIGVVGAELFHADGQTHRGTDGWSDMTKLTAAFCNFVNAPKNFICVRYELKFYANVKLF